jgi:superfamily II DNA/RNA helicase
MSRHAGSFDDLDLNLDLVVNVDPPADAKDCLQRGGRAAAPGLPAWLSPWCGPTSDAIGTA